jgi:hypothetical protein
MSAGASLHAAHAISYALQEPAKERLSDFCRRLEPVGRILELQDWRVWGCSPLDGPDGKVHVFFARWPNQTGHEGWLTHSEVAHAVADKPEGPYRVLGTVLKGRGAGAWDSDMIHNPTIHKVGNRYALFYIGNSVERARRMGEQASGAQRIGLAMADSLNGPWQRVGDGPILDVSPNRKDWDSYITVNPALLQHPNGQFWLYYKAWDKYNSGDIRKIGLAIADRIEGPYRRHPKNPLIDFSSRGVWLEDPYVFIEGKRFCMITRDHGFFTGKANNAKPTPGLLFESDDGIRWSEPAIAFKTAEAYFSEPNPDPLPRGGRFERPQILMRGGRAAYLFVAFVGGKYRTSSGAVFRVRPPAGR